MLSISHHIRIYFDFLKIPLSSFCLGPYLTMFPPLFQRHQCGRRLNLAVVWFIARQWAMQAFFPHSGLPSGVFALTRVHLGLLYPHYWLQVMFWTQSSWPWRGVRYIIVRRGTSGDRTEAAHVLNSLTLSSCWICQQMLWTRVWAA